MGLVNVNIRIFYQAYNSKIVDDSCYDIIINQCAIRSISPRMANVCKHSNKWNPFAS